MLPATYLEALWLIAVTFLLTLVLRSGLAWAEQRRAWVATVDFLHGDFQSAGFLAAPVRAASDWWLEVWPVVGTALVVPTTALVVGAVVYGIRIHKAPKPEPRHRAGGAVAAFGRALVAIPRDAVWSRFSPAVDGLRLHVKPYLKKKEVRA